MKQGSENDGKNIVEFPKKGIEFVGEQKVSVTVVKDGKEERVEEVAHVVLVDSLGGGADDYRKTFEDVLKALHLKQNTRIDEGYFGAKFVIRSRNPEDRQDRIEKFGEGEMIVGVGCSKEPDAEGNHFEAYGINKPWNDHW